MPQWAFYVNISVRIEIKNEMMIRILPCDKITSSIHVTVTLSIATSGNNNYDKVDITCQ